MSDILVVAEYVGDKVKKTSFELISKAKELASKTGGKVFGLLIGSGVSGLSKELASYGATKIVVVDNPACAKYDTTTYAEAVATVIKQLNPTVVLGTASPLGKDLFPRVAAKLDAGLASDCTSLDVEGGKLKAKKPFFSGKVLGEISFQSSLQLATTRPNSFSVDKPQDGAQAEVIQVSISPKPSKSVLKEVTQGASGKTDLSEAEIIVSGGRAMGNADNFKILFELADVIGATVGASRAAVDSGFAGHDMQVGQTGKVVNPKLYFAFGISGAIQHLAGMRTSKVIVAVNKDPEAPIFSKADYGVVGDLFTIAPMLTSEFKKLLSE